jgi:hypothetical protein
LLSVIILAGVVEDDQLAIVGPVVLFQEALDESAEFRRSQVGTADGGDFHRGNFVLSVGRG